MSLFKIVLPVDTIAQRSRITWCQENVGLYGTGWQIRCADASGHNNDLLESKHIEFIFDKKEDAKMFNMLWGPLEK